ncbi:DUF2513 domain-containing protein [Vibrio europaeus]|uniref:DUF2513 domain-containing protein n=1 Tax=Vibrio europaeus TaxID=300876 RepID=A0AAE7AYW6_9VIBR|nr:DUF2513 domain-containing protein [Vibrio europaeus]MDC5808108.1 DUF2513 domain-containing protein [Vibrio europaeus]MDC5825817.1 DUF2513 domain-containing protein [Vibrio europaeus]MDC5832806.1 DUF2513 domain-containing protein [Vibrio europaeus]MDC5837684.1 DUF2513 domain-containing protein [Vibrio europaeus]QJY39090.1 DUF2513 domain-containing protein [Vibrio europaeus]
MKIELDYLRQLLDVFLESPRAFITIKDWEESGITVDSPDEDIFDDRFIFHVSLLVENKLISNSSLENSSLKSIGIDVGNSNYHSWWEVDIRLTQDGHDFAKLLHQNEVFENLKSNFREFPFQVMLDAGKSLATAIMKNKVKELTGFTE